MLLYFGRLEYEKGVHDLIAALPRIRRAHRGTRLLVPGVRDIRGYKAMYRDFVRSVRSGRPPEMSLERALVDHRLMEQVYAAL